MPGPGPAELALSYQAISPVPQMNRFDKKKREAEPADTASVSRQLKKELGVGPQAPPRSHASVDRMEPRNPHFTGWLSLGHRSDSAGLDMCNPTDP